MNYIQVNLKHNRPLFVVSVCLKVDFIMLKNHLNLFCYDDFVNNRRFLTNLCFRVILVDENRQNGWPSLFKLRLQSRKLRLPFWWRGLKISQQISTVKWQVLTGSFPKFRVTLTQWNYFYFHYCLLLYSPKSLYVLYGPQNKDKAS